MRGVVTSPEGGVLEAALDEARMNGVRSMTGAHWLGPPFVSFILFLEVSTNNYISWGCSRAWRPWREGVRALGGVHDLHYGLHLYGRVEG